jgi:PAS domain S-box-containing protein
MQARFAGHRDGVLVVDREERLVYANPTFGELVGYDCAEFIGKLPPFPWLNGEPPTRKAEQVRFLVSEQAQELGVSVVSTELMDASGAPIATWMRCQLIVESRGTEQGYAMFFTDPARLPLLQTSGFPDATVRAEELEECLRRIAIEFERLGISTGIFPAHLRSEVWPELRALSPREWEVLWPFLDGQRVPNIAGMLHISPHTVRNHLQSVYAKVGVRSQAELIERLRPVRRGEVENEGGALCARLRSPLPHAPGD